MPKWSCFPLRYAAIGLGGLFLAAQLVPVDRTNPAVISDFRGPEAVHSILVRSCYDCHSNETRWPWYSRVAPMSWLIAKHVRDGRSDLNFSDWPVLDRASQDLLRREIDDEISKQQMPLKGYVVLHPEARLDVGDLEVLDDWLGRGREGGLDQFF